MGRRFGKYTLGDFDMEGPEFTYERRIRLGEIFSDTRENAYKRLAEAFRELYGYKCTLLPIKARTRRLNAILDDFKAWLKKEAETLAYTPTADEEAAGLKTFSRAVGPLGTIHALAERFGKDPDEVLRWDYGKVYGILFTDLERVKYQRRLDRVTNDRYKGANRRAAR